MKTLSLTAAVCLVIVLFVRPQGAAAQTGDDVTPAVEDSCSELMSATRALYGLCIAYCEAQDLAPVDPDDTDTLHRQMPKLTILENYKKKMRDGDPPMPCVKIPAPCWTEEEMAVIGTASEPTFRTLRHQVYSGCPDGRVGETWYLEEQGRVYDQNGTPIGKQIWAGTWYRTDTGEQGCWFEDDFNNIAVRVFPLGSQVEYEASRDAILTRADELGWNPSHLWETVFPSPPCP